MPSQFLSNLAGDTKTAVSSFRPYKSVRDTPSWKNGVYNFAYNLGQVGAVSNIPVSGLRGNLYDGVQMSNDFKAFASSKATATKFNSSTRRLIYKGAAYGSRIVMNKILPSGGGIAGRALRILGGRVASSQLRRFDAKVRDKLYGEFRPDSMGIDGHATNPMSRVGINLDKIQKSIQAIAISNAPAPYETWYKNNKNSDFQRQGQLNMSDDYLSEFSLTTYDGDDVDSLLSDRDITSIMGASENNDMRWNNSLPPGYEGVNISRNTHKRRSSARDYRDIAQFDAGAATYGFGKADMSQSDIDKVNDFIEATLSLAEGIDPMLDTTAADYVKDPASLKNDLARKLNELRAEHGDEIFNELGKMTGVVRYLHGDEGEVYGQPRYSTKEREMQIFDKQNEKWVEDKKVVYEESGGIRVEDVPVQYHAISSKGGDPRLHPQPDRRRIRKLVSQADTTGAGAGTVGKKMKFDRGKSVGKLTHSETIKHQGKRQSNISYKRHHSASFSDNPHRHNFVPNKRQIQGAIHSADPDYKHKKYAIIHAVRFGGTGKNSTKADAIRDAFQVEYGGPATDKYGKLANRTDMFVHTPSLFMYRSAIGAAKMWGLAVSSGKESIGTLAGGAGDLAKNPFMMNQDVRVLSRGMQGPNKLQQKIMEDLYMQASLDEHGKMLWNAATGQLALSKNKILRNSFEASTLDLLSDTLGDTLWGGAKMKGVGKRKAFEQVIKTPHSKTVGFDQVGFDTLTRKIMANDPQYRYKQKMPHQDDFDEAIKDYDSTEDGKYRWEIDRIVNEKPPTHVNYESIVDDDGNETYRIIGSRWDTGDMPIDEDGDPYLTGNVVRGSLGKQVGMEGSFDYDNAGAADDVRMLAELRKAGIDDDVGIDDPRAASLLLNAGISNITQMDQLENLLQEGYRGILANQFEGLISPQDVNTFAHKMTHNLLYAVKRGGGNEALNPDTITFIQQYFNKQTDTIKEGLKTAGLYTRQLHIDPNKKNKGAIKVAWFSHTEEEPATRDQVNRDMAGNSMFSFLFDTQGVDEICEALAPNSNALSGAIQDYVDGRITLETAIKIDSRASQHRVNKLMHTKRSNIEKGRTNVTSLDSTHLQGTESKVKVTRVGGDHPRDRDIEGTTIGAGGRSGDAPRELYPDSTSFVLAAGTEAKKDVKKLGKNPANYIGTELAKIKNSNDRQKQKSFILAKMNANDKVRSAWINFVRTEAEREDGVLLDYSVHSVMMYLNRHFPNDFGADYGKDYYEIQSMYEQDAEDF